LWKAYTRKPLRETTRFLWWNFVMGVLIMGDTACSVPGADRYSQMRPLHPCHPTPVIVMMMAACRPTVELCMETGHRAKQNTVFLDIKYAIPLIYFARKFLETDYWWSFEAG
jgi:hypothetical protein